MNLTVPFEVLKYSPAGFEYPTDLFCVLIPQLEMEMRRNCLGRPLFDFMVSHLTPYPEVFREWNGATTYNIGDVVIRNTCTHISLANCNTEDPLKVNTSWTPFKRFDHDGANYLWETFLRTIMAYKVFVASLNSTTYRAGAGGMTMNVGDGTGTRAVDKTTFLTNLTQYNGFIMTTTDNMVEWLGDNYKTAGFPKPSCVGDNCDTTPRASHRIAFR